MPAYDSADLLARLRRAIDRPADDERTTDAELFGYLADAQERWLTTIGTIVPHAVEGAPVVLASDDGGATYVVRTAAGEEVLPLHLRLFQSLERANTPGAGAVDALVPGVDFILEGTRVRFPLERARRFTGFPDGGPVARFIATPPRIAAGVQPTLLPLHARQLLVLSAAAEWAEDTGVRDPAFFEARALKLWSGTGRAGDHGLLAMYHAGAFAAGGEASAQAFRAERGGFRARPAVEALGYPVAVGDPPPSGTLVVVGSVPPILEPGDGPPTSGTDVLMLASRFDNSTGARRWHVSVGADVPELATLATSALLTMRLFRRSDGSEVPTTTPVLLEGARRAVYCQAELGGANVPLVARFQVAGGARLATSVATEAVPEAVIWPELAAHLCAQEYVPGPIRSRASRVLTLPTVWAQHDNDYARRAALDKAARDADHAAWLAAGSPTSGALAEAIMFYGRQGRATAYDNCLTLIAEGCSDGGAAGHARIFEGIRRLDRAFRLRQDPAGNSFEPEQYAAFDAIPACYWFTGHATGASGTGPEGGGDGWRRRGAYAIQACAWQQRLWLNAGPGDLSEEVGVSASSGRRLANTLRGFLLMWRLKVDDTTYGTSVNGYSFKWATTPNAAIAAFLARRAAVGYTAGPLRGSWGGSEALAQTSTDPAITGRADYRPGQPTHLPFQVGFALQKLEEVEREATVWGAPLDPVNLSGVRTTIHDSCDYYAGLCLARPLTGAGSSGDPGGWAYQVPLDNAEGPGLTPALNQFWLLPLVRTAQRTGNVAHRTLAHRLVRDHWDANAWPNSYLDNMANITVTKLLDESYAQHAQAATAFSLT